MARTGDNIYLRNTGKWEGRYIRERMEDGRLRYGYVSGVTYEETLKKREAAASAYEKNRKEKHATGTDLLFASVSQDWLDERKSFLKESSIAKYRNILTGYLLPEFGDRSITAITKEELSCFFSKLLTSGGVHGKGLSPRMVKSVISVFESVAEYTSNCNDVEVVSVGRFPLKDQKKPLRIFSITEQQKLERFLFSDIGSAELGIILCLYTGIRLGELCALKWEDISLEYRKMDIHATMMRIQTPDNPDRRTKVIITPPKSACSVREIPLPPDIFRLLQKMEEPKDTYLLTGHQNVYIEPRTMENKFKSITASCGIADANFHALRHTFATRCIEKGFDVKSLSEILGHASVKITMDRYVHPTIELKRKNMDKLSVFINGKIS